MTFSRLDMFVTSVLFLSICALYIPAYHSIYERHDAGVYLKVDVSTEGLPVIRDDSEEYAALGKHVAELGMFSTDGEVPNTIRVPVYPLFLAVVYALTGSYAFVPFLQIILVFCTSVLIYFFAVRLAEKRIAGMLASGFYLLNPSTIFYAMTVMTETLYIFLLVSFVYVVFSSSHKSIVRFVVGGLLLGAIILTRPIGMFLPFVCIPFIVWTLRDMPWKKILIRVSVFSLAVSVLVVPWLIRNYMVSGEPKLSSVVSYNFFYLLVPQFLAEQTGRKRVDIQKEFVLESGNLTDRQQMDLRYSDHLDHITHPYIISNFPQYVSYHFSTIDDFFLASGLQIFYDVLLRPNYYDLDHASFPQLQHEDHFFFSFIELERTVVWPLLYMALIYGLWVGRKKPQVVFLITLIYYYAILTGPVGYSRYRVPVEPWIFILAAIGITYLGERVYKLTMPWRRPTLD
ncbi:MAG: glycosyltransferase family 39 protein [Minisyncoccia bacterium]